MAHQVALLLLVGLLAAPMATAQSFTQINVKNRVTLAVPSDWTINDADSRKEVAKRTKDLIGSDGIVASFSAASHPAPSAAFVRVSMVPMGDGPLTQADINAELKKNRGELLKGVRDAFLQEINAIPNYRQKVKMQTEPTTDAIQIAGHTALVVTYRRGSQAAANESFQVTQYHVPLGAEKALITLSYVVSKPAAREATDRILASIKIR